MSNTAAASRMDTISANPLAQIRQLQMREIESRWPAEARERLHTDQGDYRIYGIWQATFRTGLFDHLRQFVDPAKAAIDVGALLGQYSLTLSAWCTRCLCIEPLPQYRFLENALPPNCVVRLVAAGDSKSEAVIRSPISRDGSIDFGLSSVIRDDWPAEMMFREQKVTVQPLDEIVPEALGDEPVGFIKIDVEGYELHVLRGAAMLLQKHRPTLQIEVQQEHVLPVRDLMASFGYRGVFFYRRQLLDLGVYRPEEHFAPEHRWSPETRETFDPDLIASDFFFVPVR